MRREGELVGDTSLELGKDDDESGGEKRMIDKVGRVLTESEAEHEMNGAGGDAVGRRVVRELPRLFGMAPRSLVERGRPREGEDGAARVERDGG